LTDEVLPVAILDGGLATRLRPLTISTPKALVEVGGEPFIFQQLRSLRDNRVRRAVICVGYLGELIQNIVSQRDVGLEVAFSYDGPRLLGTAGALKKALPLLGEAFFVLYGDSYLTCRFADVQHAFTVSKKPALMTVFRNEGHWDTSNVQFENGELVSYNKRSPTPCMHHIDYGLGVLSRPALETVRPDERYDLADLYQRLLERCQLAAYEVKDRFYEIGSEAGLAETRAFLR
jgi:N-acetyl-alpha-D-muramate 1-phosphate uridylyltransferase